MTVQETAGSLANNYTAGHYKTPRYFRTLWKNIIILREYQDGKERHFSEYTPDNSAAAVSRTNHMMAGITRE